MFDLYGLDPLNSGSSGGAALGSYKTSDSFSDTLQSGYFNEGAANLKITQALLVKASDKTGIILISVSGGVVSTEEFGGGSGDPVSWDDIEGKPSTFAPTIGSTSTTAMAGDTVIPAAATWENLSGKPAVIASGADASAARAAIGAGTSSLTLAQSQAGIATKPAIAALTAESTLEDVIAALQA